MNNIKNTTLLFTFLFCLLGIASCGIFSSDENIDYNWPADIVGESIEFTVREPGDSGIPAGSVIIYNYDANGSVGGINPVSNRRYTPDFYTYEADGESATIYLEYSNGDSWEEYILLQMSPLKKDPIPTKGSSVLL